MLFSSFPTKRVLQSVVFLTAIASLAVCQSITVNTDPANRFYRIDSSSGQILADTFVGTRLEAATSIVSTSLKGWSLVGVGRFHQEIGMVYWDHSTGVVAVLLYADANGSRLTGSTTLASPGSGWTPAAVADFNGDGNDDVVFVNKSTGQADVYFYGGANGTAFLNRQTISLLSTTGWNVVGASDLNGDGHPDVILQNRESGEVLANYLGGADGTTVTATQSLGTFRGWTASGMRDMNGDGHPDLVLVNPVSGKSMVTYYDGATGSNPLGTKTLDLSGLTQSTLIAASVSTSSSTTSTTQLNTASTALAVSSLTTSSAPVLIFNGTGTSSTDVTAVENVVKNAGFAYRTVNSSGLNSMTQAQLAAYKLFIVPGGNSITIGKYLTHSATTNVRNAVQQNGLHYLGICAGAFFGGYSAYYNGLNLTSGVWFSKYPDSKTKDDLMIKFPAQSALDIYWQDGPQLSGWGKIVGKYPNGQPAMVEGYSGKGFVLLSGVHPEAPSSWYYGMTLLTPVDKNLAYAQTLVKAAFNATVLPHY